MTWIKIVLFTGFSLGPALTFLFGAVEPYGSAHPDFPAFEEIASGRGGALDELGEALLHRSAATREAVRAKNWLLYHGFHYVDTTRVVSGRFDWLFYKPEFWNGRCFQEAKIDAVMKPIDVITDLAGAAGLDVTVSVSPDKSSVYPEFLHPWNHHYWACKATSGAVIRRSMAQHAPRVVDHAAALLAERSRRPKRKLYFHTDTHWTPFGAALALRQLLRSVFPSPAADRLKPPRFSTESFLRATDLRNGMLLLSKRERAGSIDASTEDGLRAVNDDPPGTKTVLFVDSFYEHMRGPLQAIFPLAEIFSIEDDRAYGDALASADRVIINSVERLLIHRAGETLTVGGPLGNAVLQRNLASARRCSDFVEVPLFTPGHMPRRWLDVSASEQGLTPSGPDPRVAVSVPEPARDRLVCVRITVEGRAAASLEVFLPVKDEDRRRFEARRSFYLDVRPGMQTTTFVLPKYVNGGAVRLDLGDGDEPQMVLRSLELGEIDAPASRLQTAD